MAAVELQDDGAPLERQLRRVHVRQLDHARLAARVAVAEPAAIPSRSEVGDDVELLSRVEKRLLEREVVARRDEELVQQAPFAQPRRQRREESVHGRRRSGGLA